jgi:starch synthase
VRVLVVTPEAVPFAKTGGLADVAGALPKALMGMGVDVRLVIPKYRVVDEGRFGLRDTGITLRVPISESFKKAGVLIGETPEKVPVYFIKKDPYYDREGLYVTREGDYPDNAERFVFFSRAAVELSKAIGFRADVIHCNDWQTALIPVYLKTLYRNDPFFSDTATVYTVHNLGYQGLFWHFDMHLTGLGWDLFTPDGIEFHGKINLMKGGLVFSDAITTVSKKYGREIQTEEFGHGLEGVIAQRSGDLYGIVNGIDYDEWDPARDPHIAGNFTPDDIKGKALCKAELQRLYSLPVRKDIPLLAMISRLVDQKGFDLIEEAIDRLMAMDLQFVFLGTGERRYEELLEEIGRRYPKKAGVRIAYDTPLAHRIEAGADIFLMPSRYEPCGLNQLYSLRYGTIPVVRATGGLDDTVKNFNSKTGNGNGFKFRDYSVEALLKEVKRAVDIYRGKRVWKGIMQNAMRCDFSWEHSAKGYLKVYRKALDKARRPH